MSVTGAVPLICRGWFKELSTYFLALLLCTISLDYVFKLTRADLRYPMITGGDGPVSYLIVKNVIERGTYYSCDRIGAPYGTDLRDFPVPDTCHLAVIKLLSLGSHNPYRVTNVFYFLTYYFTTVLALFSFRQFNIARMPALVAALLYAFLPYHPLRGIGHLFLSAYYLIPPTVMLVLWLYQGKLSRQSDAVAESGHPLRWRWVAAIVICLFASAGGAYYTFFACFFLGVAGIAAAFQGKTLTSLLQTGLLITVVGLGFTMNMLPNLLYKHEHGANPDVANRLTWEAEIYALQLSHLLLPMPEHRWPAIRHIRDFYSFNGPLPQHEGCLTAILGTIGSIGFVVVVMWFFFGRRTGEYSRLLSGLGMFSMAGFVLGTVGGLGRLFAAYVSPQIRAYNRVSIFIGFFALFAVALFLTWVTQKAARWGLPGRLAAGSFCLLVLAAGIWDQTIPSMVPDYAGSRATFECEVAFASKVEQSLPRGAMVFQLPFLTFPENPGIVQCGGYDHFRLYMASHELQVSHGTMCGRYGAGILAELSRKPINEQVDLIVAMGYSGIHIDRRGYADQGRAVEAILRTLVGQEPLVSGNGRDVFYSLVSLAERRRQRYGNEEWEALQQWYRYPVVGLWQKGAGRDEGGARCYRSPATLKLINPMPQTRTVTVHFIPELPPQDRAPHMQVSGAILPETQPIDLSGAPVCLRVSVPHGEHTLCFECDGKLIRDLHGRAQEFRLKSFEVISGETAPDRFGTPEQFKKSTDQRLSLANPLTRSAIVGNSQVTMSPGQEGLVVRATGDDPSLILPAFASDHSGELLMRLEMSSPADTFVELFYETRETPGYSATRSMRYNIRKGRNTLYIPLKDPALSGKLRFDPGTVPGEYILHDLDIRALPLESSE